MKISTRFRLLDKRLKSIGKKERKMARARVLQCVGGVGSCWPLPPSLTIDYDQKSIDVDIILLL
jgi:hypothetical protein